MTFCLLKKVQFYLHKLDWTNLWCRVIKFLKNSISRCFRYYHKRPIKRWHLGMAIQAWLVCSTMVARTKIIRYNTGGTFKALKAIKVQVNEDIKTVLQPSFMLNAVWLFVVSFLYSKWEFIVGTSFNIFYICHQVPCHRQHLICRGIFIIQKKIKLADELWDLMTMGKSFPTKVNFPHIMKMFKLLGFHTLYKGRANLD